LRGDINIESFIILNRFIKFIPKIDAKLINHYIWPDLKRKLVKYEPFLCYDKEKFKDSLLAMMNEFVK
jgi:T4 gene Gp59 loader of gp41 DNA helicase C-term